MATSALLLGVLTAAGAANQPSMSRRAAGLQTCGLGGLAPCLSALLGPGPRTCQSKTVVSAPANTDPARATALAQLIENVPCPASGRASYATRDSRKQEMGVLDPIEDPAGGYLGVYHTSIGFSAAATNADYKISLAHSIDLIHWSPIGVLDPAGAAMPTLREIPASQGYLLAYEKAQSPRDTVIRVRYYPSLDALLAGEFSAQRDLPRRFSPYNNGTPSILSVHWRGSLHRSVITLAFHYKSATGDTPGADREAVGTLRGFRAWTANKEANVDTLLLQDGFQGSHGDRRQFDFDGQRWRIYEAQTSFGDFATWHLVLLDPSSNLTYPLTMTTDTRTFSTSFGNPTVQVERAPTGIGQVLVVTMFVFSAGNAAKNGGELVYYQPL